MNVNNPHNNNDNNNNRSMNRQVQMAGDKSGERSIVSSILEDDDDESEIDDGATNISYTIHEEDETDIENETDDDLSETNYDENDHSTTYRSHYGTSLGPFSEDEGLDDDDIDDDSDLLFDDASSHRPRHHHHHRRHHHNQHHHHHRHNMNNIHEHDNNHDTNNHDQNDDHHATNHLLDNHDHGDDDDDDDDSNEENDEEATQLNDTSTSSNSNSTHSNNASPNNARRTILQTLARGGQSSPTTTSSGIVPQVDYSIMLEEAESTLHELLEQFDYDDSNNNNNSNNNDLTIHTYREALIHLGNKWEQINEQIIDEHEQQIHIITQERIDIEMAMIELEQRHRDEIDMTKQEVMEQSQKIIMQEMKDNADRELKSVETIDLAVKNAIQETKAQMNQEFDIALNGMKDAQQELQKRYELLIQETETRVKHDVQEQAEKDAQVQIQSFMESYNELKQQVVDLTMEVEKAKMEADLACGSNDVLLDISADVELDDDDDNLGGSSRGRDKIKSSSTTNKLQAIIQSKDEEIESLQQSLNKRLKQIQHLTIQHQNEVQNLQSSVQHDKALLMQKINLYEETQKREYEETLQSELERVVKQTKLDLNAEFEIILQGMKSTQDELEKKYKQIIKETEIKVRHDVQEGAKVDAERKISAFMESYNEMKSQVVDMTMEIDQLKAMAEEGGEIDSIVQKKDEEIRQLKESITTLSETQREEYEQQCLVLKTKYDEEMNSLSKQLKLKNEDMEKIENEMKTKINRFEHLNQKKFDQLKQTYESKIVNLEGIIDENTRTLTQRELEYQRSLDVATKDRTKAYEEQIQSIKDGEVQKLKDMKQVHANEMKELKEKYRKEKVGLQKSIDKMEIIIADQEHQLETAAANDTTHNDLSVEMKVLKRQHEKKMEDLLDLLHSTKVENQKLQDMQKVTTEGYKDSINLLKEDHASNIEIMKQKFMQASKEMQGELVKLKKENALLASASGGGGGGLSVRRETIASNSVHHNQDAKAGSYVLPEARTALSRSVKSGEDNKENSVASASVADTDSHASALKSTATPPRNNADQTFQDLSPLTLGSPSPSKPGGGKRSRIPPTTTPTRNQVRSTDTGSANRPRKTPDVPRSTARSSSRRVSHASSTSSASKMPSPSKTNTTSRRSQRSLAQSPSGAAGFTRVSPLDKMKHATSRSTTRSKPSAASRKLTSPPISNIKVVDRTPGTVMMKPSISRFHANDGIVAATKRRETVRNLQEEVQYPCLMIINVPITDKMRKMAKILRLPLTDNPLEATHVIAGDNNHHIRRTAKFMASLCMTSNILKTEWLEDSYKKRSLLSCSHYSLLHDTKAENMYSFSMKQTLIEGKERRRDGGLLSGWKILVCDDVAGNKAPRESDLRMMVEAAGGEWLLKSNIPVPISEDPTHVIVITSDPALSSQIDDEKASIAAENGAGFFSTTWLFDCMMHQKLFGLRRGIGRL